MHENSLVDRNLHFQSVGMLFVAVGRQVRAAILGTLEELGKRGAAPGSPEGDHRTVTAERQPFAKIRELRPETPGTGSPMATTVSRVGMWAIDAL
ncbi:hypothetical protein DZK25_01265 [Wenzhouxiangella sp. 15181]|nr:hypothetical protein DZK25_01265 [Wenzhouxiangella sp. 15181]RFP67557.1 hypothetical protein DZK26_12180 [Wenzhouxiangella sp. 15190]